MKIVICGLLKFPAGDAGSLRQYQLATMLRELGHDVLVAGLGATNNRRIEQYGEVDYISFRYGDNKLQNKVLSHLLYWKNLKNILGDYAPDAIIMDDLGPSKTIKLKQYCKVKQIRLIHDSVEWYSPEQFKHGKFSWGYITKDILNRFLIDENCGVIAISRYLEEHFKAKGCRCVRIPIVITEADLCKEKELPEDKVVFTYAGQPGKKDYLHVMLDAFALLPDELLQRLVFNIIGCTKEQMIAAGIGREVLNKLDQQLVVHGRVSHDEVLRILKGTHFTLLMRSPDQRYAKAGFPTKVVESLSRSTPIICNLTSDLKMYLTDGEDSMHVQGGSAIELCKQIARAMNLSKKEQEMMCENAYTTALMRFNNKEYMDQFLSIFR